MPTWKKLIHSGSDAELNSVNIGTPGDGTYTDGFFDTFTPDTLTGEAIDQISEAFLDLAPARAETLTGKDLIINSPLTNTGKIAEGLTSTDWYQGGVSAHDLVNTLVSSTNMVLKSPSSNDTFRAGKNSDLQAGTLTGGVTASIEGPTGVGSIQANRALSDGIGLTGNINITDISQYNTFWAKANAQVDLTLTSTGSYRSTITADNGAGSTNETNIFYVGTGTDFPNVSINNFTTTVTTSTDKYLSGITYYASANLTLTPDVDNLFYPVYQDNGLIANSTYIPSTQFNLGAPTYTDSYTSPDTTALANDKSSGTDLASITLTARKPLKSDITSTSTIPGKPVNTYGTESTSTVEQFLDEDRRITDLSQTAWNPTTALSAGEAIVANGVLKSPTQVDYTNLDQDYSSLADDNGYFDYFRTFDMSPGIQEFDFTFLTNNISQISEWDSTGDIQVALIKTNETNLIGDFGRALGNNSGNIQGIKTGTPGELSGTVSIPAGNNGLNITSVILWIKIKSNSNGEFSNLSITQ